MPSAHNLNFELDMEDKRSPARKRCETIRVEGHQVEVTPVFYAYWEFAAERQAMFFKRLYKANTTLTNDSVLRIYRFTNSYRASDRVSQFLIRNVIYRDDLPGDVRNVFFRIMLFKIFNKIETWKVFEQELGDIAWETFRFADYDRVLSKSRSRGERIYSAAYIMPSAGGAFGSGVKHQNHLRLIEYFMEKAFPERAADCKNMADVFELLRSAPSLGPFLAYQYAIDLNYSSLTDFDESDFVVPGPGALDGIQKCFIGGHAALRPTSLIRYMYENQERYFSDLGIQFQSLWGRRLQLIDCQNLFCEISKYARAAFPEYNGTAGRTRIKQKYTQRGQLPAPWYPPKWKINSKIDERLSSDVAGVGDCHHRAENLPR